MKIYNHIESFTGVKNPVLTSGTFDGVHIGHKAIIHRINDIAQKIGGESVLLTFEPHPRKVLFPEDEDPRLLSSLDEKIALLEKAGLDHLIFYPFSLEFSRLSALDYVRNLLVNGIGVHTMVVGYDHHFGRNREGNFAQLIDFSQTYGFEVQEIPAQEINDVNVSSTKVRNALIKGDLQIANQFLGYNYQLTGTVEHGNALGRQLGFPTANLNISDKNKLIPADGVYAVMAEIQGIKHEAMLNIGTRPTLENEGKRSIEVHIMNFDREIYTETLTLELHHRIRNEMRFPSIDELKAQLLIDQTTAKELLKEA